MLGGIVTSRISDFLSSHSFGTSFPSFLKIFPAPLQLGHACCTCITPNGVCACWATCHDPLHVGQVSSWTSSHCIRLSNFIFFLAHRYDSSNVTVILYLISSPLLGLALQRPPNHHCHPKIHHIKSPISKSPKSPPENQPCPPNHHWPNQPENPHFL
jgi:hypothetical protein